MQYKLHLTNSYMRHLILFKFGHNFYIYSCNIENINKCCILFISYHLISIHDIDSNIGLAIGLRVFGKHLGTTLAYSSAS